MTNVCGYTLKDAEEALLKDGFCVENVYLTKAPRESQEYDILNTRVVKVNKIDDVKVELIVVKSLWNNF